MNTNKTESIRFFWNGIKVNGGKLIRCYYFTDSRSDSVTISARDYDHLPRDLFTVKNETDLYTDYFDSDSATLTPAHPLYKYARAAALKSAMRGEPEYIAKLEQDAQDAQQPGRYHWRKPEDIRAEIDRRQAQLDRYAAELATLPKGHPTAADVEAVHEMNTAAESARLAREHAEQLERREKAIRTRNENRAFIEQTAAAHPIKDGAPVVTVEWSENGAFDDGMKFSVAAAEIIFKTLDEKISADQERGYDKTSFSITYTNADGEQDTYKGRYDLGDNEGGLIAHIRSFGAFLRDKGNFGNGKPTDEDKEPGAAIVAVADQLEQSCITGDKRTKVYYCHPYSSWERGSNENVNGMIRRRHPKGTDFSKVTAEEIAATENWINSYPRKIFGYKSAGTMFRECLRELGLTA